MSNKTVIRLTLSVMVIVISHRLMIDINSDWTIIIPYIGALIINFIYNETKSMIT